MLLNGDRPRDLIRLVRKHFGADPRLFPVIRDVVQQIDHPNLQIGIQTYVRQSGRQAELVGTNGATAAQLVDPPTYLGRGWRPKTSAVQYSTFHFGEEDSMPCVQQGMYLIREGDTPLLFSIHHQYSEVGHGMAIEVIVVAPTSEAGERCLAEVRSWMKKKNVYRGRCLSFAKDEFGDGLRFHKLPTVAANDIILPQGLLRSIERVTVEFSEHAEALKAAGRHMKRGVLLHGPPGTGKTLTAMYLASRMPNRTVLLLTGESLGLLDRMCTFARLLQPATVILEDIDLVAEERTSSAPGCHPLLFELLNHMDGIGEDADVLFVLTTNRAHLLEPALAARPGRVDLAVEIPLPDAECRRRLLELYGDGLNMQLTDPDTLVRRTQGVSAAFIRELLRKAALSAAIAKREVVTDAHLEEALQDLVYSGGDLTRSLLGASRIGLAAD